MNDDELTATLRKGWLPGTTHHVAAARIEALVAENAALRANEGRVPVSWNECAVWLEAGGVVLAVKAADLQTPTVYSPAEFKEGTVFGLAEPECYRLLPPPGLVAAPEGMDGGGWLGEGRHVPEGWEWRIGPNQEFFTDEPLGNFVQCRPPVRVRAVVEVPLTRLVGRTIEGCAVAVNKADVTEYGQGWWALHDLIQDRRDFPAGTLDLSTGLVRVYAEGDQT